MEKICQVTLGMDNFPIVRSVHSGTPIREEQLYTLVSTLEEKEGNIGMGGTKPRNERNKNFKEKYVFS